MKRKKLTYEEWTCIISKDMKIKLSEVSGAKMYLVLNCINQVSEPQIWTFNGEPIVMCDKGIHWLSILPLTGKYCITAMINPKGDIILWYIDMIASWGIDENGIPYIDDLYLDLIVYPDGTIIVDDRDELEDAYRSGDISEELYNMALETCDNIQTKISKSMDDFVEFTHKCYLNVL